MEYLFRITVLSGIGWLWLFIRYPDKTERTEIFKEEYDNLYHRAGSIIILRLVFSIALIGILFCIAAMIVSLIISLIKLI
jgi:hypothetical protein